MGPRLKVALAIALPLGVAGLAVAALSSHHHRTTPDAAAWQQGVNSAFKTVVADLPALLTADQQWVAGTGSTPSLAALVAHDQPDFQRAVDQLDALAPFASAPHAVVDDDQAARLYVEFLRVEAAAVALPAGEFRDQLHQATRRLRTLGDRVFDRGRAAVDPTFFTNPSQDVSVELPPEVPDWTAEAMAPGPPLAAPPPSAPATPPTRQATRPQQPAGAWLAAVRRAGIPAPAAVAAIVTASTTPSDAGRLGRLADDLTAAASRLRALADPAGQRERATEFGLAVLVEAESARIAQAALLGNPGLFDVGRQLGSIADVLWEPALR